MLGILHLRHEKTFTACCLQGREVQAVITHKFFEEKPLMTSFVPVGNCYWISPSQHVELLLQGQLAGLQREASIPSTNRRTRVCSLLFQCDSCLCSLASVSGRIPSNVPFSSNCLCWSLLDHGRSLKDLYLYSCSFFARLDILLMPSLGVEEVDCRKSVQLTVQYSLQ